MKTNFGAFCAIYKLFSQQKTKINELDENEVSIERAVFDLYNVGDLKDLSQQTTYLIGIKMTTFLQFNITRLFYILLTQEGKTDVVGIIKNTDLTLAKFKNRLQQSQTQMKFEITDGIHEAKVTFWDAFAEEFEEVIKQDLKYPLIIIIGCGRVSQWQGKYSTFFHNLFIYMKYLNVTFNSIYVIIR